jgi:hypothetical protein
MTCVAVAPPKCFLKPPCFSARPAYLPEPTAGWLFSAAAANATKFQERLLLRVLATDQSKKEAFRDLLLGAFELH